MRIHLRLLCVSLLASLSLGIPLLEDISLLRRDLKDDVCGSESADHVASDDRNADTWNNNDIAGWFSQALELYEEANWTWPGGTHQPNIQSVILNMMGNDGSEQCDEITVSVCSGTGLPWEKCKQHPEATFVWFATTHWAQFLSKMQSSLTITHSAVEGLTSNIVKKFYTPQDDPTKLIVPISVVSGIAGAISVVFPPAGLVAGAGSVANGILTQAGLDKADPLEQWAEVTDAVANAFIALTDGFTKTFDHTLKQLPPQGGTVGDLKLTKHISQTKYTDDPFQLPQILSHGGYAKTPAVGTMNDGVFGGLVATAVNALWATEKVFIMILTDEAWGKGPGQACKALESMTECINGVAHILFRWIVSATKAPVVPNAMANPTELVARDWYVWGAYEAGPSRGGDANANNMNQYHLSRTDVILSAVKTFNEKGFPFKDQNAATVQHLQDNPLELKQSDLMFFSLPICDLGAIMGAGKHIDWDVGGEDKHPIEVYGACTCIQGKGWPADYGLSGGLPKNICNSHWKDNPSA